MDPPPPPQPSDSLIGRSKGSSKPRKERRGASSEQVPAQTSAPGPSPDAPRVPRDNDRGGRGRGRGRVQHQSGRGSRVQWQPRSAPQRPSAGQSSTGEASGNGGDAGERGDATQWLANALGVSGRGDRDDDVNQGRQQPQVARGQRSTRPHQDASGGQAGPSDVGLPQQQPLSYHQQQGGAYYHRQHQHRQASAAQGSQAGLDYDSLQQQQQQHGNHPNHYPAGGGASYGGGGYQGHRNGDGGAVYGYGAAHAAANGSHYHGQQQHYIPQDPAALPLPMNFQNPNLGGFPGRFPDWAGGGRGRGGGGRGRRGARGGHFAQPPHQQQQFVDQYSAPPPPQQQQQYGAQQPRQQQGVTQQQQQQYSYGGEQQQRPAKRQPRPGERHKQAAEGPGVTRVCVDIEEEEDEELADENAESCVVCCEPMREVAIGACNHREVCARCCLRLRMCYDDTKCPQCRALLSEVVVTRWRPELPSFEQLASEKASLWQRRSWAKGVLVDDSPPAPSSRTDGAATAAAGGARRGGGSGGGSVQQRLSGRLQCLTGMACAVCDPRGRRPLPTDKALLAHVRQKHRERLCHVCLKARRLFPLELEVFAGPEELQQHVDSKHPSCQFCRVAFHDAEQLYSHMQREHFTCHVCGQLDRQYQYFQHAAGLLQHLRKEHYVCEDPECADCLTAFGTPEELQRHHHTRHSTYMPRWDSRAARPLLFDFTPTLADLARPGRQPRRGSSRQSQQSAAGERPGSRQQQQQPPTSLVPEAEPPEMAQEGQEPGWRMVDDDLGMLPGGGGGQQAGVGPGASGPPPLPSTAAAAPRGAWSGGRSGSAVAATPASAFPTLRAAAAAAAAVAGAEPQQRVLPRLVKQTVRCPCGRRVSYPVLTEGEQAPALRCDAECQRLKRRTQLADAFGVGDPDHHVPFADRNRTPTWSPQLLLMARQHREWVQGIERELALFLGDTSESRGRLPAMGKDQRAAVHQLAEQYGLATKGTDASGGGRYVELLKTPGASVPNRLLSHAAAALTDDEVAALQGQVVGHAMRLVDVARSCDVAAHLREWEGCYTLDPPGGPATSEDGASVTVRFASQAALQAALQRLGGGIRGLFRLQRGGGGAGAGAAGVVAAGAGMNGAAGPVAAAAAVAPARVSDATAAPPPSVAAVTAAMAAAPRPRQPSSLTQAAAAVQPSPASAAGVADGGGGGWEVQAGRRAASSSARAAVPPGGGGPGPSSSTLQLMQGGGDPWDEEDGERRRQQMRASAAAGGAGGSAASAVASVAAAAADDWEEFAEEGSSEEGEREGGGEGRGGAGLRVAPPASQPPKQQQQQRTGDGARRAAAGLGAAGGGVAMQLTAAPLGGSTMWAALQGDQGSGDEDGSD